MSLTADKQARTTRRAKGLHSSDLADLPGLPLVGEEQMHVTPQASVTTLATCSLSVPVGGVLGDAAMSLG